jgi:hypothetical protein
VRKQQTILRARHESFVSATDDGDSATDITNKDIEVPTNTTEE